MRSNRTTLQTWVYIVFNHTNWLIKTRHSHSLCSNNISKGFLEPSSLYAREFLDFFYLCPKTEENFPPWDLNIVFWKLLINWDYDKFCRTGLQYVFIMPSPVDYRGGKLITHDYYWLFSLHGHVLLQSLVCKADWQYHGITTLTVEYILLILLLQYFVSSKFL